MDGTKESTLDYFDKLLDDELIDARFNCAVESVKKEGDIVFNSGGSIAIALNHGHRIVTHILERRK